MSNIQQQAPVSNEVLRRLSQAAVPSLSTVPQENSTLTIIDGVEILNKVTNENELLIQNNLDQSPTNNSILNTKNSTPKDEELKED